MLYPLSRSLFVHCMIYLQRANRAICPPARHPRFVVDRPSFLQISSSSLRRAQIRSIGVTLFSPTISASSFRCAWARFTFLPRAFLLPDQLAHNFTTFESAHAPLLRARTFLLPRSTSAQLRRASIRRTYLSSPSCARARLLSLSDRLADNFVMFDFFYRFLLNARSIYTRVDAKRYRDGTSHRDKAISSQQM